MPETAQRYRQRPSIVRAMQLTAETTMDLIEWLPTSRFRITDEAGMPRLWVQTAGGGFECTYPGQWVVHESDGFHVYSATVFERMYEPEPPRKFAVGYITHCCDGGDVSVLDADGHRLFDTWSYDLHVDINLAAAELAALREEQPAEDWRVYVLTEIPQPEMSGDA